MADALRTLLASAIDYAGLYPPAGLSMADSAREHASYLGGAHAWALGRFVVAASRLPELEQATEKIWNSSRRWRISALVASPAEVAHCVAFNQRRPDVAVIDTIELKATTADELRSAVTGIPNTIAAYVEIPLAAAAPLAPLITDAKVFAKIRTGGLAAQAYPSCAEIARAIAVFARARLPFKATAGLHHPLRRVAPFTYLPNSATGTMHGFLNLLIAAAFIWQGSDESQGIPVLEESAHDGFRFDADGVSWRGHRLDSAALKDCRENFLRSFGSCSFTEPIAELTELGLLR
jgi:hypothetical protein